MANNSLLQGTMLNQDSSIFTNKNSSHTNFMRLVPPPKKKVGAVIEDPTGPYQASVSCTRTVTTTERLDQAHLFPLRLGLLLYPFLVVPRGLLEFVRLHVLLVAIVVHHVPQLLKTTPHTKTPKAATRVRQNGNTDGKCPRQQRRANHRPRQNRVESYVKRQQSCCCATTATTTADHSK